MNFRKFFYVAAISLILAVAAPVYAKSVTASVFDSFLSALANAAEQIMPQPPLSEEIEEGAEQDYVDPREVQQVQRELRDIKRELTRFRKQLSKLKNNADDVSSIDNLLELINGFQQKVNSGENLRDVIQEFRDAQIWDEANRFRAKIEVPNEIKQRGKEIKRIETLLKKKTTQTVANYFGIDFVGLGVKIADAKSGLAKVQEYYNSGDLDNSIEQLDEIRQDFQPWDVTSVLQRLQEMYNGVKKIKDSEIKDGVKEILSEVVLDFNEGNYQSARELLEEASGDLMQLIFPKKGSSKEKLMAILEQLEDKMGEKSSDIWDKVKEKSVKRQEIKEEINKKIEDRKNEFKQQETSKIEVCPAMPTVDKCPAGQKMISRFISDKCGSYNVCVSESDKTTDTPCPSFASWKRWDENGKPYCQKINNKGERLCSYDMNAPESDYKSVCPSESTSANTCNNNGKCESWETYNCSDCGTRTGTWVSHIWRFSDNATENSMILNRTDSEYLNYIKEIENQCLKITRNKFAWKSGAGNDSDWRNFGIPDCSGNADTSNVCGNGVCSSGETASSCPSDCGSSTTTGQKEQVWNNKGLRSWIRSDADTSRIDSLKTACANVSSGMNIWMPNAGTYSSSDFGMPDPGKCARASACASDQYFNGADCVSSQSGQAGANTCPAGQYWENGACRTSSSTGGGSSSMRRCFYPNAFRNGQPMGYTVWCESDYYNCRQGDPSGSTVSLDGLSLGAPSSCESGYSAGGGGTTGGSGTTCSSGQYWNGTSCVNNTTTSSTTACNNNGACEYGESSGSCPSDCSSGGSGNSCPSGQYWNGSACVNSTSGSGAGSAMDPAAGCAQAGGTWDSARNYCNMPGSSGASNCPSGQYWNGTACVASTTQQPAGLWSIIKQLFTFWR